MHRTGLALVAAGVLAAAVPGIAVGGDGNEAYFIQKSPDGTPYGNTLTIDQERADYSLVTGINSNLVGGVGAWVVGAVSGVDPLNASQRGEANRATLTLEGTGGEVQLLQAPLPGAPWVIGGAGGGNVAEITSLDASLGGVIQAGNNNTAIMSLDDSRGLIVQLGSNLSANLTVAASGSGTVIQRGDNSTVGDVVVYGGTNLIYTQIGDGLTQHAQVEAFSTTPGTVTITQIAR